MRRPEPSSTPETPKKGILRSASTYLYNKMPSPRTYLSLH